MVSPDLIFPTDGGQAATDDALASVQGDLERLLASLAAPAGKNAAAPLYLILSSKSALSRKYGSSAFARLDADLRELRQTVRERRGIEALLVYVDDEATLATYGLRPVDPSQPGQVKALIDALEGCLEGRRISYLLIVGGESIIPFHKLPNPIDDQDELVLSDNLYASRDGDYFIPDRAVGRLPDGKGEGIDLLRSLVHTAIEGHCQAASRKGLLDVIAQTLRREESPARNGHSFGYSASIWRKASRMVFETIGDGRHLRISPPLSCQELKVAAPPRFSYFNLHGVEDGPNWYGQRDALFPADYPLFPLALRPQDLSAATCGGSIVLSEACYGACVTGRRSEESIALRMLALGALAFVGSTRVSYGAIVPPLVCADLIGRYFWAGLLGRLSVGEALLYAKVSLAREMQQRQGYLDGEDQKTLLSFVLYGDPALSATTHRPLPAEREKLACPPLLCQHQPPQAKSAVSDRLIDMVEQTIALNLPHMLHAPMRAERIRLCSGACSRRCHPAHSKAAAPAPEQWAFILRKDIPVAGESAHRQVVKVTVDPQGHVIKMSVSR